MTQKLKLMGRKRGMTQRFDKDGNVVVCTVIQAAPNVITQIKTKDTDGYDAIQTAFEPVVAGDERTVARRVGKPLMGHFKKSGSTPSRFLQETRLSAPVDLKLGDSVTVAQFAEGDLVDASGTTKGKGFQGLMKKNNFSGGPAAHGSGFHRHAGSTGMRSTPGWCFKGSPRPSQMGNEKCTVQNLEVINVDEARGLLMVRGAVPGPVGGVITVSTAVKK